MQRIVVLPSPNLSLEYRRASLMAASLARRRCCRKRPCLQRSSPPEPAQAPPGAACNTNWTRAPGAAPARQGLGKDRRAVPQAQTAIPPTKSRYDFPLRPTPGILPPDQGQGKPRVGMNMYRSHFHGVQACVFLRHPSFSLHVHQACGPPPRKRLPVCHGMISVPTPALVKSPEVWRVPFARR